jgi:putative transposase
MARRHRLQLAGLSQHVTQRGNNRADLFKTTDDYEAFLMFLGLALRRHPVRLHGYALMKNHVHLVMTPDKAGAIARTMQVVGLRYVQYFNRQYGRTGGLFEGRYRATIIDTDVYWLRCLRYVEFNPVRAGLVSRAEAYPWSSYAANAFGMPDGLVSPHPLYSALGHAPDERQRQWRDFCATEEAGADIAVLRKALQAGGALGRVMIPEDVCQPEQS